MKNVKVLHEQILDIQPNEQGEYVITAKDLDTLVSTLKSYLNGKKFRNLPNPHSKDMLSVSVSAIDLIKKIQYITKGLLEANEIQEDTYGFLTGTVTSFGKWNNEINKTFIPKAKVALERFEEDLKKANEDSSKKQEMFSEVETATIAAEPRGEEDAVVSVKTKKGQRFIFDKVNYTLTYKVKGSDKVVKLVPKDSWRSTILSWLVKVVDWVVTKYKDFCDLCVGIKQSIQFKYLQYKFNKEAKKEQKKDASDDVLDLPPLLS